MSGRSAQISSRAVASCSSGETRMPAISRACCAPATSPAGHDKAMSSTSSGRVQRSEEHTSELQSLMRISYAVFCLKKKNNKRKSHENYTSQTKIAPDYTCHMRTCPIVINTIYAQD